MGWISRYYDRRVALAPDQNLLWQVGHTENGRPITEAQFDAMVTRIRDQLDLQPGDRLLDLGCGNGVFTRALAAHVQTVVGVDFSPALIDIAQRESRVENVSYLVGDAVTPPSGPSSGGRFNKVLMNAALQHLSMPQLQSLLKTLVKQSAPDSAYLFAFVPDADRRAAFEAQLKPGFSLRLRRMFGRDLLGHWYGRDSITRLCDEMGLQVEFPPVDPSINGSRYRFNILIR